MSLLGSSQMAAPDGEKADSAAESARVLVEAVRKDLKPRDIITRKSIENAVALVMATGGSTNAVLHYLAIASAAGVKWTIDDFERMKRLALVLAAAAAIPASLPAQAQEELAKKHACLACHAVDKKLVGPAYKDVAAKYRGDASAEAKLVEKVKKGSQGTWGQVPMPPNTNVPDADVRALVKWILSQK